MGKYTGYKTTVIPGTGFDGTRRGGFFGLDIGQLLSVESHPCSVISLNGCFVLETTNSFLQTLLPPAEGLYQKMGDGLTIGNLWQRLRRASYIGHLEGRSERAH
jgi:hypothetical protein